MMKNKSIFKSGKTVIADPVHYHTLLVACCIFLFISLYVYTRTLYEQFFVIPCMVFLGVLLERNKDMECRKVFILPGAMVAWFLFLQIKRGFAHTQLDTIGLFLATYLFAFPLATLLQDGDKKRALKVFAATYLASATVLSLYSLLLILDCLPEYFSRFIYWNGTRLNVLWHPNIAACMLMVGIIFCTTFLSQANSRGKKLGFAVLLIALLGTLALTNCRTVIILTGCYFGAILFFGMIKYGKKWIALGALAVLLLPAVLYLSAASLYQVNENALATKNIPQSYEQTIFENSDERTETECISDKIIVPHETESISITPETVPAMKTETGTAPKDASAEVVPAGNTDVTQEDSLQLTAKNGIFTENGEMYYYVNGMKTYAGLIQIDEDYYYVNSSCKVVTGSYTISKNNELLPVATYEFGADGKMLNAPDSGDALKNGIVMEDGEMYYYVNGIKTYAGLIQIDEDYYYVNSSCKVVTGSYTISKNNDLLPVATYEFAADGKMLNRSATDDTIYSDANNIDLMMDAPQDSIINDISTLNSRVHIWKATYLAIRDMPSILYWGLPDPGEYVSHYITPIAHLHNAWLQCLVGMGFVGFLIAMLFTLLTFWNCLVILVKHHQDVWKRNVALLTLCLMANSILEPYLFYTTVDQHVPDFLFFLCAGYLVHWQEADNHNYLTMICSKIPFLNK